ACKQCTSEPTCSGTCPKVDKGVCNELKCNDPNAKYLKVNNKLDKATCQAHTTEDDQTVFRWMLDQEVVTNATCVSTVHCRDVNPLTLSSKPGAKTGIDMSKSPLKCENENELIEVNGKKATEINCDEKTGEWSITDKDVKQSIAKGSVLSCVVAETTTTALPAGASMGSVEYIAMGVGGIVLIAVIGVIIFCVITQHRKKAKRNAASKIQTINESSKQDPQLKIAVPLYPLPTATMSDPPKKAEPELVEKTMIALTPTIEKPKSLTMKTAVLTPMSERDNGPQQVGEDTLRVIEEDARERK
ncbi:hypothetical protein PMAYCL1PPCAC_28662, partial [Pristionchus mayeri]